MRQIYKIIFLLFLFLPFLACKQRKSTTKIISELIRKFPRLENTSKTNSSSYHLVRTVSLVKPDVSIELYSQSDSVDDRNQIILITNSDLKSYGIPLLSNTFRNYWRFPNENTNSDKGDTTFTFQHELNKCLDTLNLNDTIGSAGKIVDELLSSILHCQLVEISDSSKLLVLMINGYSRSPDENSDTCFMRLRKNWDIISRELFPNKAIRYNSVYWDEANSRVYMFDYSNFKRHKLNTFKITSFRQDCPHHTYSM